MKHVLFQVLSLVAIILVHTTRSDVRSYPDKYDDLLWAFAANKMAEDEVLNEDVTRTDVPKKLDIRMPNVSPQKPESYICTAVKMPEDDGYIVGYEPHAKMQTAHHMLMFGCDKAVEMDSGDYWRCGEMVGTCQGSVNKIMYAWAKDAKALTLPKDVGFHVGGKSNIKYIVLQVHYANVDKFIRDHVTDQSGVTLHLSSKRPKYFAGIYLVAAGGPPIPSKQEVFDMNMACLYSSGPTMHPFAFRVHTHTLGYVVTGYRVRDGKWNLIGKGDPRRPQAFYHVGSEKPLQAGDILAARCTYNSMKRDRTTYIGATGADEMCNFYLMYYYDPAEGDSSDSCSSVTVPSSDYPADTDVPLDPAKKTTSKRHIEDQREEPKLTLQEIWPGESKSTQEMPIGQISGVSVQSTGDIVIFHRADRKWEFDTFDSYNVLNADLRRLPIGVDTVLFLDKNTGEASRTWGKEQFYFPHGVSIDDEDNMWFTDVGMHQVFKYSKDGRKLLVLGEKFIPGSDNYHFCKPTDVAVEKDGNFFVSDGYCNGRVVKFSANGAVLFVIDDRLLSKSPSFTPPYSFLIPHSLSSDNDGNVVYVADREHGRVLSFDMKTGSFLYQYTGFGDKVFAIAYSDGVLYVVNGESLLQPSIKGFTFSLKRNKTVQEWQPEMGFSYPHDIACDPSGHFVYISEITSPGKLWKFAVRQERTSFV